MFSRLDLFKPMPHFIHDYGDFRFGSAYKAGETKPQKRKSEESKDMIMDYIKIVEKIKNTKEELSELEIQKEEMETEMLLNPLTKTIIEELSNVENKGKTR